MTITRMDFYREVFFFFLRLVIEGSAEVADRVVPSIWRAYAINMTRSSAHGSATPSDLVGRSKSRKRGSWTRELSELNLARGFATSWMKKRCCKGVVTWATWRLRKVVVVADKSLM